MEKQNSEFIDDEIETTYTREDTEINGANEPKTVNEDTSEDIVIWKESDDIDSLENESFEEEFSENDMEIQQLNQDALSFDNPRKNSFKTFLERSISFIRSDNETYWKKKDIRLARFLKDNKRSRKKLEKLKYAAFEELYNCIREDSLKRSINTFLSVQEKDTLYEGIEVLNVRRFVMEERIKNPAYYFEKKCAACWNYANVLRLLEGSYDEKIAVFFDGFRKYLWVRADVVEKPTNNSLLVVVHLLNKHDKKELRKQESTYKKELKSQLKQVKLKRNLLKDTNDIQNTGEIKSRIERRKLKHI